MGCAYSFHQETAVDLLNKTLKIAIFQPKMAQKWPVMAKIPNFFFDPILLCLTSIQLIGTRLFFAFKELRVVLLNKTLKMAIFQPKMARNGQKFPIFYIDPIWLCLTSIQLIGMRLFFYIKELCVNLLNKTLKMAIFQPKMAQKWPLMAKIPKFFFGSNMIMPYEYPVN